MKKLMLMALVILFTMPMFSQNVIYTIATRGTKVGKPTKIGDFVYITADLTLYQLKKAYGRDVTGTLILASGANYAVANSTWVSGAVAATTITASSTLGVTGATTLAGALNAAGAIGFGTSNNKFTVAAATGNTAIAGTLAVTGATTLAGKLMSYWVDTATAQNIYGIKSFQVPIKYVLGSNASNIAMTYGSEAAGTSVTSGQYNILFGGGKAVTTGSSNISLGYHSLLTATTSSNNIGIGTLSLATNGSGSENIGIGGYAMTANTTGVKNISIGDQSLKSNTTGGYNVAIGYNAGTGTKTGSGNIIIGKNAGNAGATSTTSNQLIVSNIVGGQDTAIVYGVMNGTPTTNTLQLNAATKISGDFTGTVLIRGSDAFTTTATRKAIYIAGAASTDYYMVRGIATDQYTRPVAGDLLNCFAKTDSLIVMRAVGTTSGMGFSYFRMK